MNTADNNEKKGADKRTLVIGGATVLICIASVVTLALRPGSSEDVIAADDTLATDNTIESQMSDDSGAASSNTETDEAAEVTTDDAAPVPQVSINYASTESDEESLQQLVKDTITSANIQIEEARNDQHFDDFSVIMLAIDDARERNGLLETFAPSGDVESPLAEDRSNWTYLDVSGAIGGLLFYEKNPARSLLEQSDMLKNFVSNGVYSFDVELIDDFTITEAFDMIFVDSETGNFDVNFEISMMYRGQEWVALVGNVNDGYRILDVVKPEDLDNTLVYNGVEAPVNVTSEEPIEEIVNVPVQEEQGNQNIETSQEEQENYGLVRVGYGDNVRYVTMDEFENIDSFIGWPNYTGPREGYYYDADILDYRPIGSRYSDAMYINSSMSEEEYGASGGTYCENCY